MFQFDDVMLLTCYYVPELDRYWPIAANTGRIPAAVGTSRHGYAGYATYK